MFVCPSCKNSFMKSMDRNVFKCINDQCKLYNYSFPSVNNKPILIPFGESECIFEKSKISSFYNLGSKKRNSSSKIRDIKNTLKKIIMGVNNKSIENFKYLEKKINNKTKILIIGGGIIGNGSIDFYEKFKKEEIKLQAIDIYDSENITAIADAHYLPFSDESFDLVIIQAVLEHVLNPKKVVKEIFRVTNNNGIIYAETPFMQSVHEGPFDFSRFTHSGHRYLFKDFIEINSGYINGAFSSILFITSHSLAGLFRSKLIGLLIRIFFSRISKSLDVLIGKKWNNDVACGCYFIGKKKKIIKKSNSPSWIIDYYKGAQK
mgnify:CR=1 FL=1